MRRRSISGFVRPSDASRTTSSSAAVSDSQPGGTGERTARVAVESVQERSMARGMGSRPAHGARGAAADGCEAVRKNF